MSSLARHREGTPDGSRSASRCPERDAQAVANEQGLARKLTERQMSMIAIGGAIGTGLFLGSALAVRTAGPAVILSYIFTSVIALLLMYCLSEMAVAHPTAGSFGVYADLYRLAVGRLRRALHLLGRAIASPSAEKPSPRPSIRSGGFPTRPRGRGSSSTRGC